LGGRSTSPLIFATVVSSALSYVQPVFGGTTEIMKEIIGRSLGL
jgi:hypothetical protein